MLYISTHIMVYNLNGGRETLQGDRARKVQSRAGEWNHRMCTSFHPRRGCKS